MSTIKVNKIENTATADGGIAIDSSGHVQVDGQQLPTAGALANRNLVMNGAMTVAQRSTSETGLTANTNFILDRFRVYISNIGTYTISQASDAPAGFKYSYKVDCTTADASPAAADEIHFSYKFEGQDLQHLKKGTSGAEKVTLSFWVKSNKTTSGQVSLRDLENTRIIAATYTISAANTWEYKTITFAGDTSGTLTSDHAARMEIQWFLDSGSNASSGTTPTAWEAEVTADKNATNFGLASSTDNYWQITGVQLEVGAAATSFEHRSYGDELARCQRYFRRFCEGVQYASAPSSGYGVSSTSAYHNVDLSPEMRSVPTLAAFSNLRTDDVTGGQAITALSLVSSMSSTEAVFLNATSASGLTQYRPYALLANNTTGAKLDLSAEL